MKKIGIIGSHGTGKSTLVSKLYENLSKNYDAGKVTNVERMCKLPLNQNAPKETQLWIMHRMVAEEIENSYKKDILIVDGGILSSYVYTLQHKFNDGIFKINFDYWIKTYDYLFKTFLNPDCFKEDGIRAMEEEFRLEIDNLMLDFLKNEKIKYYQLSKDREDYTNTIKHIIEITKL